MAQYYRGYHGRPSLYTNAKGHIMPFEYVIVYVHQRGKYHHEYYVRWSGLGKPPPEWRSIRHPDKYKGRGLRFRYLIRVKRKVS